MAIQEAMFTASLTALLTIGSIGCGDDNGSSKAPPPIVDVVDPVTNPDGPQKLCASLQSCNLVPAGYSQQDCADAFDICLSRQVSSVRDDWNTSLDECLKYSSCQIQASCFQPLVEFCL